MATRSHPLMPMGHSYWGNVASLAQLPNVVGATIQSAKVRAGDIVFVVAEAGVYVCVTPTVGSAAWSALQTDSSPTLFRPASAGDFTLLSREAGTTMTIGVGTMAAEPFYDQITLTSLGGATPGMTWWETPVAIPATNRFRIMGKLGPRATAASGVSPQIGFAMQNYDRAAWIQRSNPTTTLINTVIRNNVAGESLATGGNAVTGVGPNASPGGGDFFADVVVRQPSPGVDPAFEITMYGFGSASGSNGQGKRVNSLSTLYLGGNPPHSLGWDAAWQSGGNLKICVGGYEYAGAGASFIAGFRIQKHPLDW